MNFLDPYDISSGFSTPPPNQSEQSLDEEVNQVIGQLGRFWGGFKKQATLEVARKDFSDVVLQAQKELNKFTGDAADEQPIASGSNPGEPEPQPRASSETLKQESPPENETASSNHSVQNFFSRLQSSLPPNVVSTVQANLPESLKHISENTDFVQLRSSLTAEFQRLQGVTRTQAEDYVHKSEVLLRDAMKEAGEVLRDAVKVLPPDVGTFSDSGLVWDGSDMWMLPSDSGDPLSSDKGKGKLNSQSAVATRADALLKRLRSDPEILKHDPEGDGGVQEIYLQWFALEVDSRDSGLENLYWKEKMDEILKSDEGRPLRATMDALVPSTLSHDVFWKRYFFRVYQIQTEEEKRKALLHSTVESEEEFSWEDDEGDDNAAPKKDKNERTQPSASVTARSPEPSSQANTPANTSPRESSEESYDVVSGNVSASGEAKKMVEESDGDSDWE
ncbi:hypothetical protein D9757_000709 [Collybiopsis confluens]|uniref:BSD domain-containing protein n=1 Tax=Collybiopsis confluens TaxID=2823264 RepID=A0A8H5I0X8_9AGAR|nr:hypothetical protein D9757_000709 [Collybiopsis confluens]